MSCHIPDTVRVVNRFRSMKNSERRGSSVFNPFSDDVITVTEEERMMLQEKEAKLNHQSKLILTLKVHHAEVTRSSYQKQEFFKQEMAHLKSQLNLTQHEFSSLQTKHDQKSKEVEELRIKVLSTTSHQKQEFFRQEISRLKTELNFVHREFSSLERKYDKKSQDLEELCIKVDAKDKMLQEVKAKLNLQSELILTMKAHQAEAAAASQQKEELLKQELNIVKESADKKNMELQESEAQIKHQSELILTMETRLAELAASNQQKVELLEQQLDCSNLAAKSAVSELSKLNMNYNQKSKEVDSLKVLMKEFNEKLDERNMLLQEKDAKINRQSEAITYYTSVIFLEKKNEKKMLLQEKDAKIKSQSELILKREAELAELVTSSQQKAQLLQQQLDRSNRATESAYRKISYLNKKYSWKCREFHSMRAVIQGFNGLLVGFGLKPLTWQQTDFRP